MNTISDHLINNRIFTTLKAINEELALNPQKNYLFDLSYLSIINLEGAKSIDFLQGQLSCDVTRVSDIQMIQGAQCNLKGRIVTLMDVLDWQGVKLVLPKDLIEATINSLNKTAMLSRVSLKENKDLNVLGFYLQNHADILPESSFFPDTLYTLTYGVDYCCYHLGKGFYVFLVQNDLAESLCKQFSEKNQLLGSLTWHTLRLSAHQLEIYPESRGLFLPHRLDLHETPYLSFNKGCYKGQEIIARMHYKGTLKHELNLYVVKTEEKIYSGQKLLTELDGSEIGELVDFSLLDNYSYLVAVSIIKNSPTSVWFEGHHQLLQLEKQLA